MRRQGQTDLVRQVDQTATPHSPDREWFTLRITVKPTPAPEPSQGGAKEDASAKSAAAKRDTSTQSKADATAKSAASGAAAKLKPATPARAAAEDVLLHQPGGELGAANWPLMLGRRGFACRRKRNVK